MNRISPDEALTTPAGELAAHCSESLFQLKSDATDLLAAAKAIVEHIDYALDIKYADKARQLHVILFYHSSITLPMPCCTAHS